MDEIKISFVSPVILLKMRRGIISFLFFLSSLERICSLKIKKETAVLAGKLLPPAPPFPSA
ncbi:MAG: hypothetical protein V1770_02270 [bacterium]